jgi:hypothetical protein
MNADWHWIPMVLAAYAAVLTTWTVVRAKPEPPRCPRCGCYQFVYKGDRQVCRDCGRE